MCNKKHECCINFFCDRWQHVAEASATIDKSVSFKCRHSIIIAQSDRTYGIGLLCGWLSSPWVVRGSGGGYQAVEVILLRALSTLHPSV
jgi:hypothetical protein